VGTVTLSAGNGFGEPGSTGNPLEQPSSLISAGTITSPSVNVKLHRGPPALVVPPVAIPLTQIVQADKETGYCFIVLPEIL
jgi:hypothetical protein